VDHRFKGRKTRHGKQPRVFRVRWKGYGPEEDLWLAESELSNAKQALAEYLQSVGLEES
jgi:hypothetical protein